MNILVVGGGGREHAIIKKLRENQSIKTIYALPGNGGIAADAVCVTGGADTYADTAVYLTSLLRDGDCVLFKASRSMALEKIAQTVTDKPNN